MLTKEYRYRGWLGCCPVYLVEVEGEGEIQLVERHLLLRPALFFSIHMIQLCNVVLTWLVPDYSPGFPIQVTGEIRHG